MVSRGWRSVISTVSLTIVVSIPLLGSVTANAQDILSLPRSRPTRWLEIRELEGSVDALHGGGNWHDAHLNDRLLLPGDGVKTDADSEASLAFDDGIGSVRVFEESRMQILTMFIDAQGGKITEIDVPEGTARFQIRRFNRPTSALTIQSPAGIAGVRGTDFGVGITPRGRTAVATFQGAVEAKAQGIAVNVEDGTYSIVIPGEVPTPPDSLSGADVDLGIVDLDLVEDTAEPTGRLMGKVFPINLVYVNGEIIDIDVSGNFVVSAVLDDRQKFLVEVRSPSGDSQGYELTVTEDDWTRQHLLP